MADNDERKWRDEVLAGAGRSDRDTPELRAQAALGYFTTAQLAAEDAVDAAVAARSKAEAQVQAADTAKEHAEAALDAAKTDVARARRLLDDIRSGADVSAHTAPRPGEDVAVHAGVALGSGSANGEGSV